MEDIYKELNKIDNEINREFLKLDILTNKNEEFWNNISLEEFEKFLDEYEIGFDAILHNKNLKKVKSDKILLIFEIMKRKNQRFFG